MCSCNALALRHICVQVDLIFNAIGHANDHDFLYMGTGIFNGYL